MIDRWCFHVRGEAALAEQKLSLRRSQGLTWRRKSPTDFSGTDRMRFVRLNRQ
jgi:hypothetical protein